MEIFELAVELGQALKKDERLVALENAKKAYDADPELSKWAVEYEVQQKAMQAEVGKPERDLHLIDMIQHRSDELYRMITAHPAFIALNETQKVVNDLMNEVNQMIMTQINGEESNCTHDCSTCGGCH